MKIQIILVKVLVLGALFIISNQDLHLLVSSERGVFFNSYSDWVVSLLGRITDATGNLVKLEWFPK